MNIFDQAEQERVSGSAEAAIPLYQQVIEGESVPEERFSATHMQGVCYRLIGDFEASERVLRQALRLAPQDKRALVLRDLGDTLRKEEKYDEAADTLRASLELLIKQHADAPEMAATMGFQSRVLADEEDYDEALARAREAADMFAQGDNRHMELYHNIFLATLLVYCEQPEGARTLAESLLPVAAQYGKPVHTEKLQLVIEHADDPDALIQAIKQQA